MRYYLTGFMGSGKTHFGKLWAEDNSLVFYDLDELIESKAGMAIQDIFATHGEAYFRSCEALVLRDTIHLNDCIIACGGGTACYFDNMEWMNKNGCSIFLNETENNIYLHLKNDKKERPLLDNTEISLQNFIRTKLAERLVFYNKASFILNTNQLNNEGFRMLLKRINNA